MEGVLLSWLTVFYFLADPGADPAVTGFLGRQQARQLACAHVSQAEAHRLHPIEVPETGARTAVLVNSDAVICERRLLPAGMRAPRDELVLATLHDDVAGLVRQAAALGASDTRWLVDAFYPSPLVAQKIAGAARTSLAEAGYAVSNSAPLLAAGDVEVLFHLAIADALPLACQRMAAEGTLGATDAFVALALVRPQESQLHAGVCMQGSWRWLR